MMKNIDITKISGHPDNPRKDLGDLTELAASIKENGILQNLTVVPWFSSATSQPVDDSKMDGHYVAVIGHRRLAAAKLAGLTEVPCVIAKMDMKTQVSTMLLENMQRSDLTVYEQAQGFQMMLNLGETIGNIAQKTGFSETTVRRRTRLLDLENDSFKSAVERGATLADFAELDKISDHALKNSVLDQIGTANFNYSIKSAIDKEKSDLRKAELFAKLDTFALVIDTDVSKEYTYVKYVSLSEGAVFETPADAHERQYYYAKKPSFVELYVKKSVNQNTQNDTAEIERQRISALRDQLDEIANRVFKLRQEFIKTYSVAKAKQNIGAIIEFSIRMTMRGSYRNFNEDMLLELLGVELSDDDNFSFEMIAAELAASPARILLLTTYCNSADNPKLNYYDWSCKYKSNEKLEELYAALAALGYEMSDEEKALSDGTHELYETVKENTDGG